MGITNLVIILEPDEGVYFPGQDVVGHVRANVTCSTPCTAVEVNCKGKSHVQWTVNRNDEVRTHTASERHFIVSTTMWSSAGSYHKMLPAGSYTWPFSFRIPEDSPSSFEAIHGNIRYRLKVKANIPNRVPVKSILYFSVNTPLDLNRNENAMKPLVVNKSDTSGILCCKSGPISLNFNCKRSGAVVGENFKIRGEVMNMGSDTLSGTSVTLWQEVHFYAEGQHKSSSCEVFKLERGEILPGDSDIYADVPFKIKAVAPSIANCQIMKLSYKLKFYARCGFFSGVSCSVPFTIGTVPFVIKGGSPMPLRQPPVMDPVMPPVMPSPYPPMPVFAPYPTNVASPYPAVPYPAVPYSAVPYPSAPPAFVTPIVGYPSPTPYVAPMVVPATAVKGQPLLIKQPLPQPNPFPITYGPHYEPCWLSREDGGRSRLDRKAPRPYYVSYDGVMIIEH